MQYFKTMKWREDWQDLARDLVTSEYAKYYADCDVPLPDLNDEEPEDEDEELPPSTPSGHTSSRASSSRPSTYTADGDDEQEEEIVEARDDRSSSSAPSRDGEVRPLHVLSPLTVPDVFSDL